MRKLYIINLIGLTGIIAGVALAEELTLTTYYPAPYGVYRQMRTTESLLLQAEPMNSNGPQLEWRTSGIGVDRHWNIDQYQDPGSTRLRFFTEDNAGDINPAIRLTILENGRVGIGTTNPGDKLQVIGHTRVGIDGTNYLQIGHGGTNSYINAVGVGRLDFRHEGSNQMVLTDTGSLGIGTAAPDGKLGVDGEINFVPQGSAPAGDKGDLYYDNTDDEFKYYDGSGWQALGGGGGCYVSYSGGCLAGFVNMGFIGNCGFCTRVVFSGGYAHFRPAGASCRAGWISRGLAQAHVCCQ